ncbi:Uncharacterized conserved protein, LabA/DUF88 family [Sinosporangium album]|uniref:Uncharacterized conserved protein, LabA/DUF88 family n=1 Tax=Sinosporangium album TaxID=504805 RepID=A0A1G7TYN0_9ACTN|nr:NYN domain-containing protein [Sinosporangium album]SDG40278.1 Uncharacterized conserved protein, LabA/DUF88 family [Sinosporangium album]
MDRCALFVDAGYLVADGAMAVHGTRHREATSWDFPGLLQLVSDLARERTGLPLLRCYWYEATVEGRNTAEHDALAELPGLKLRLSRIRPGRREGVDAQVHRDLMTLARNNAICDAVVVSGDEDLTQAICDAQDLGIRVTVIQIAAESSFAASRTLRNECDDIVEIGSGQLRPYVTLATGADSVVGNGHQPGVSTVTQPTHGPGGHLASPNRSAAGQAHPASSAGAREIGAGGHANGSTPAPAARSHVSPPAPPALPALPSYPAYLHDTASSPTASQNTTGSLPVVHPPAAPTSPGVYQPQPVGAYGGPQAVPVPAATGGATTTLAEAVKSAHKEGHDFGESVARDAPALWLEAVLARKPRMPSDLEARLLQGSALPIDFLLHDEVRHALRRGFWDALERARR